MLSKVLIFLSSHALLVLSNPLYLGDTPFSGDQSSAFLVPYDWQAEFMSDFQIHDSCNATQKEQIQGGLSEAAEIAKHAKEHSMFFTTPLGQQSLLTLLFFFFCVKQFS